VLESEELFGPAPHFDSYHFLVVVSDQVPRLGLEHRQSSLNSARADAFRDLDWTKNGLGYLLPHEFVHAWVGKFRRPAGMVTADFHEPKNTEGLWVYEGLTQYLGNVLAARSGLVTLQDFRERMAIYTAARQRERGRQWRPLRDTAASSYILRGGSSSWGLMRRGQSYYVEGALMWLDFDARILRESAGAVGLDQFCREFFGDGGSSVEVRGFEQADVVTALQRVNDQSPWLELIDVAVFQTQEKFVALWAQSAGYRLEVTDERPASLKGRESRGKYIYLGESLGLTVSNEGMVTSVTPGGVGDQAGMFEGLKIVGVDGYQFSPERLRSAVEASPATGNIDLLALDDDRYVDLALSYAGGLRYLHAVPIDAEVDRLAMIAAARRPGAQTTQEE
jgi:predicted metalloprotease with PDZ domain